tara:strand:- start:19355 stop:20041 length:687 start_codon:yes stop_codon:yes gene_type:complete
MNNTRYYEKKNDGVFFAKCHKDDQVDTVNDGRMWRHWTFGDKEGKTLGYESAEIHGLIESAYLKEFADKTYLNIGVQHPQGVDVLQVELMAKDAQTLAKKLRGINLAEEVCFGTWLNTKGAFQAHGRTIVPCYLTVQQSNGVKGVAVPSTFAFVDGVGYEGLPAGVKTQKMGKDVWSFEERDEVLFKEVEDFVKRVEVECAGRKDSRPQTPAEAAPVETEAVLDDIVF